MEKIALSPGGKLVAMGGWTSAVGVWHRGTGRRLWFNSKTVPFKGTRPSSSTFFAFSPDEQQLAVRSSEKLLILSASTGAVVRSLSTVALYDTVAWSPDGRLLAGNASGGGFKVWDVRTGACIRDVVPHSQLMAALAFSPDSSRLAVGDYGGVVQVWRIR